MTIVKICDPWRRQLAKTHWLWKTASDDVGAPFGAKKIEYAQPFSLAASASRPLLGCMENGIARAINRYRAADPTDLDSAECICFFAHPNYIWDARQPFETIWIETSEIEDCRWGILTTVRGDGEQLERGGIYLAFVQHPDFETVCTFFGHWTILESLANWRHGVLSEADFCEAQRCGRPAFLTKASPVESIEDLRRLLAARAGSGLGCIADDGGDPGALMDYSLGGQFTSMLVTAIAMINGEAFYSKRTLLKHTGEQALRSWYHVLH